MQLWLAIPLLALVGILIMLTAVIVFRERGEADLVREARAEARAAARDSRAAAREAYYQVSRCRERRRQACSIAKGGAARKEAEELEAKL